MRPGLGVWQSNPDAYRATHPYVIFKIKSIQNEQFTTKVPLAPRPTTH